MKNNVNPRIYKPNFVSKVINNEVINFDLVINKTVNQLIPSKKPLKNISKSELEKLKQEINLFQIIINNMFSGQPRVPYPRFILKMAFEYLSYKFGEKIVFKKKYNLIRDLITKKIDNYDSKIGFGLKLEYDKDTDKNIISHKIGIKFDSKIKDWVFYFSFYNLIDYFFVLPYDKIYKECEDEIINKK